MTRDVLRRHFSAQHVGLGIPEHNQHDHDRERRGDAQRRRFRDLADRHVDVAGDVPPASGTVAATMNQEP